MPNDRDFHTDSWKDQVPKDLVLPSFEATWMLNTVLQRVDPPGATVSSPVPEVALDELLQEGYEGARKRSSSLSIGRDRLV